MTREFDLLVVGEINPDLVLRGEDVTPAFGQAEKLVEAATLTIGSSSAIMACGAARLGLRTAFLGVVGDDVFGRFMLEALAARDVDTSACLVDKTQPTGLSIILSQPHDRAIFTHLGTISALRFEQIDLSLLERAHHLHVGSFFLLHRLQPDLGELFRQAHRLGLSTSLDTNWDPEGRWDGGLAEVWSECDIFLPNEAEARHLAKQETFEEALEVLAALVPTLAVKLGAAGGLARQGRETVRAPSLPIEVIDTTGAGDSFDAGFLYGYLNGWPLQRSLELACACGTLSTHAPGGTDAQPSLAEALAALKGL